MTCNGHFEGHMSLSNKFERKLVITTRGETISFNSHTELMEACLLLVLQMENIHTVDGVTDYFHLSGYFSLVLLQESWQDPLDRVCVTLTEFQMMSSIPHTHKCL